MHVHALALDVLSLGFRECLAEVSRHLSAVEGLDVCDGLQPRLLSHLTSVALALTSHRPPLHQHPPHLHPQYWAAALSPPPDASSASQRPAEVLQRVASASSCPPLAHPASTSVLPPSTSFPLRPRGTEGGAF